MANKYKLVIVESPAKAKTIEKYLGPDFKVIASMGHIRDLPQRDFGIDLTSWDLEIVTIPGKEDTIKNIVALAKDAEEVFLASDPDREGEAIAFHIQEVIKRRDAHRVLFNAITKPAVLQAIQNPLKLDTHKYSAQKTRRVLDRIVGYKISPILWSKLKPGLSAGRVQSVALRLIVEREQEILSFIPEKWFQIVAWLSKDAIEFETKYFGVQVDKKKDIEDEAEAKAILAAVQNQAFTVAHLETKEKKKSPTAPFTTSKLQQEAANKLGFPSKKTMQIAQKLYEGINVTGHGRQGLITYMRTDSVRSEPVAIDSVRAFIGQKYGPDYLPAAPVIHVKKKSDVKAQDAHEAIRPTNFVLEPDAIRRDLDPDEYKLYNLIWNKFVASQMNPAVLDQTVIMFQVQNTSYFFKSVGSVVKFPGFMAVYKEAQEEKKSKQGGEDPEEKEAELSLPILQAGENLTPIKPPELQEKFTSPPPRFNDGTLVKELEERGVGRPSTYAAIISNISERQYVSKNKEQRFFPTELGTSLCKMLVDNFPRQLDVSFTAKMEDELDTIENGGMDWKTVATTFWDSLSKTIQEVQERLPNIPREPRVVRPEDKSGLICEVCNLGEYLVRKGSKGDFLACSRYPECRSTKNFKRTKKGIEIVVPKKQYFEDMVCPTCGKRMVVVKGTKGKFLSCEDYPNCKTTRPIPLEFKCAVCASGRLVHKKSAKGTVFWGCNNYPECKAVYWNKPIKQACSQCQHEWMEEIEYKDKETKQKKKFVKCPKCQKKEAVKPPPKEPPRES